MSKIINDQTLSFITDEVKQSITKSDVLAKIVGDAPLGNNGLNRVKIGDAVRIVISESKLDVEPGQQMIRLRGAQKVMNVRPFSLAALRVLLDRSGEQVDSEEATKLQKALDKNQPMLDGKELLPLDGATTSDKLGDLNVGTLQEFAMGFDEHTHLEQFAYVCVGKVPSINRDAMKNAGTAARPKLEKEPTYQFVQSAYTGAEEARELQNQIDWTTEDPDVAGRKWREAKASYLQSLPIEDRANASNLFWTPVFRAIKIA